MINFLIESKKFQNKMIETHRKRIPETLDPLEFLKFSKNQKIQIFLLYEENLKTVSQR